MKNTAFYIAQRYLIAKKGNTAVTVITLLAAIAMMIAVSSMFVIVSVFAGLEDLNRDMVSNLHADLTIKSTKGKTIQNLSNVVSALKQNSEISHFSKVIEEKVYVSYQNIGEIAYLRAVDSAYVFVNPIDKSIFYGNYPSFKYSNEVLMENQLDDRLSIPVGSNQDFATILMPKPGKGIINKEEDIFTKKEFYVTGVFPGNDQINNYIISPLELAQELLNLPKNSAYQIVIKLNKPENADLVKENLLKQLNSQNIEIKTKSEENAAFWKMINTEKMFIYLIFALVIFITTFNLAGAIIILQLDKKHQAKSLLALGLTMKSLRNIYFYTGFLIVIFGIMSGLALGTAVCYFQIKTNFFDASPNLPFPVKITWKNYLIVTFTAFLFGIFVSWFFSKVNKVSFKEI